MFKVHLILNAHLDPIWLWSWRDGLDEVLNTSYYICNLLDRHPDIIYTRGEAWVYEQVRRIDPPLFERIRAHVKAGRWSCVGGWYIQPDCNQPSGFALERQIALGHEFFREHFGAAPRIGYNVDSFGHAATLPGYMRQAGQSAYVMMRPQEHEMKLPARLFRWRGYADGPEVTTFRIAAAYCTQVGIHPEHIHNALTELPDGVTHTMCFVGIGDHGGGPTEAMIEWCRANRHAFPNAELVFSSPEKFFAAVESERQHLPLVVGELQMHAIGCYSVHRPVKLALRKAEHRLVQAEKILENSETPPTEFVRDLEIAWKQVCFHHFHDTLGGTCLPSAYEDVSAQLGKALATADEVAAILLRRRVVQLKDNPAQRLVFFNASDAPFHDYIEIEPWLEWSQWQPSWKLADDRSKTVAHQVLRPEASGSATQTRLFFHATIAPGETHTLRIVEGTSSVEPPAHAFTITDASLHAANGAAIVTGESARLELPHLTAPAVLRLVTYEDLTDTWSHGIDRYERKKPESVRWQSSTGVDRGPLMASLIQRGLLGSSSVHAEWRVFGDRPWIECRLRIVWSEQFRILKLECEAPSTATERTDGIPGGSLVRSQNGCELPLRDWTCLDIANSEGNTAQFAVLAPDVYAISGEPGRLGLTLLRGCPLAWHDPAPANDPRCVFSDRGEHFFRIRFMSAPAFSCKELNEMANGWQRPPLTADVTRGMKNRAQHGSYTPGISI